MSNTLNTPVEALETEFPLRVRELSLRRGSGGGGRHRGGDGIVREIEALAPMRYTLITERRRHAPQGRDGRRGRRAGPQLLNGEPLRRARPKVSCAPGDRLRIETPGRRRRGRADKQHESQIWLFGGSLVLDCRIRAGPTPPPRTVEASSLPKSSRSSAF